jgi:hypothetical protein
MADWGTSAGPRRDQTARKEQSWGISSCLLLPPFPCSAGAICFSLLFFPLRKRVFHSNPCKLHNCAGPVQPTEKLNICSALLSTSPMFYIQFNCSKI